MTSPPPEPAPAVPVEGSARDGEILDADDPAFLAADAEELRARTMTLSDRLSRLPGLGLALTVLGLLAGLAALLVPLRGRLLGLLP